jgi:hypothetical protein
MMGPLVAAIEHVDSQLDRVHDRRRDSMNDGTGKLAKDNRDTDQELGDYGPLADLIALHTAAGVEDLWRALVVGPGLRYGQSFDAVGLFKRHHGNGEPGALGTALLLCTDGRWDGDSGRLVRALVATGTLGDGDIGQLIECFLWSDRYRVTYPAGWVSAEWLEIDVGDAPDTRGSRLVRIDPDSPVSMERPIAPPLRRWAAATALRRDPRMLTSLAGRALELDSRDGAAVMAGVLDAIDALDDRAARRAIELGLDWPRGSVRIQALDLLAASDAELARSLAAVDPDAKVRAWITRRARSDDGAAQIRPGEARSNPAQLDLFRDE